MNKDALRDVRKKLHLSQMEFGSLLGAHTMTVSKWERGILAPSSYQLAMISRFGAVVDSRDREQVAHVKQLLASGGPLEAIAWLLQRRVAC